MGTFSGGDGPDARHHRTAPRAPDPPDHALPAPRRGLYLIKPPDQRSPGLQRIVTAPLELTRNALPPASGQAQPAGNCAAGGSYRDRHGHYQGFIVSQTGIRRARARYPPSIPARTMTTSAKRQQARRQRAPGHDPARPCLSRPSRRNPPPWHASSPVHGCHAAQLRVGMDLATYAMAAMTADAGSLPSCFTDCRRSRTAACARPAPRRVRAAGPASVTLGAGSHREGGVYAGEEVGDRGHRAGCVPLFAVLRCCTRSVLPAREFENRPPSRDSQGFESQTSCLLRNRSGEPLVRADQSGG